MNKIVKKFETYTHFYEYDFLTLSEFCNYNSLGMINWTIDRLLNLKERIHNEDIIYENEILSDELFKEIISELFSEHIYNEIFKDT